MTSAFNKATEWGRTFNISSIRSEGDIACLTIRQLKVLASKINSQMGLVISKSRFGKVYSNMTKAELIQAIWYVRKLVLCAPKGKYEMGELSPRIHGQFCNGIQHVIYFGFGKEFDANKFYYWLNSGKSFCSLSSVRKADRLKSLGFEFEVKVWDIDFELLTKLISKDSGQKQLDKELANEQIELAVAQKMYDNTKESAKAKQAMIAFLDRRGFEIVGNKVEVKF